MKRILLISVLLTMLLSCSVRPEAMPSDLDRQFLETVPADDMNQSLKLDILNDEGIFRSGSEIQVIIYNKSSNFVSFTGDSYIKLLTTQNDEWVEVNNQLTYSGTFLLSPQGVPVLDGKYTVVEPILDENMIDEGEKQSLLRIVVIGEIVKNKVPTKKFVGAYVDVYISP